MLSRQAKYYAKHISMLLKYLGIKRSPAYRNAVVLHKNLQRLKDRDRKKVEEITLKIVDTSFFFQHGCKLLLAGEITNVL